MRYVAIITIIFCLVPLAGCEPLIRFPANFVEVDAVDRGIYDLRAVSADGVVIALRKIENPRNGTLDFWCEAVENELVGQGYSVVETKQAEAESGLAGQVITFKNLQQGQDYTYVLAIFLKDRHILLAEAGGRTANVKKRMAEINKSLLTVK